MPKASSGRGKYDRSQTSTARGAERRERLLDSATKVFARRGYASTRVDDIVEHAGISRRSLYEAFDSLEQILTEIYERAMRITFNTILERLLTITDPVERVHVGIAAYYESIASSPSAARVIFEEYRIAGPTQAARFELNTTRFTMLLLKSLSAAFATGQLGRAPDEVTVYALIKGCEAIAVRAIHRGEHAQLPDVAPTMSRLILEAFRSPAP